MSDLSGWAYDSPTPTAELALFQQKLLPTVLMFAFGYYILRLLDLGPPSILSFLWQCFVYVTPSRVIYAAEQFIHRSENHHYDSPHFTMQNFGNQHAKSEALRRLFVDTNSQMKAVIQRASMISYLNITHSRAGLLPPGLGNSGASCYQSSILQALASLPQFTRFISQMASQMNPDDDDETTEITRALNLLLRELNDESVGVRTLWAPAALKPMGTFEQQDAQEYLTKILEEVDDEIKKNQDRKTSKPGLESLAQSLERAPAFEFEFCDGSEDIAVSDAQSAHQNKEPSKGDHVLRVERCLATENPVNMFVGIGFKCTECNTYNVRCELFKYLMLNLGKNEEMIEQLVENYTAGEVMAGVECTHCTEIVQQTADKQDLGVQTNPVYRKKIKKATIARPPQDLIVHIGRSQFNMYGDSVKIDTEVEFGSEFAMERRWILFPDQYDNHPLYELKAVIIHVGSHESGHYVAYCQRGKEWYRFDDAYVLRVPREEVLEAGNVFMLFYESIE